MDAKLKKRWVKALRSGKYKQCQVALHSRKTGGYCCLGVLGVVMGQDKERLAEGDAYEPIIEAVGGDSVMMGLYSINDDCYEPPFELIAGFIQENL